MSSSPWPAILSRVIGLAFIGIPVGIWQGLSPLGWLLYAAALVPIAALGGLAAWYGARKAEERIAAREGRPRADKHEGT